MTKLYRGKSTQRTRSAVFRAKRRLALNLAQNAINYAHAYDLPHWIQVNCALFPQERGYSLFIPWQEMSSALQHWHADGLFQRFFFMRKPPGLRLRFYGNALEERLEPLLIAWLEEAECRNAIRGFRLALYEPEEFRFGGPSGMAIAHEQFDLDSRIVLRYELMTDNNRIGLERDLFSLALTNDLFQRCTEDGAELWDIWKRLQQALNSVIPACSCSTVALEREHNAITFAPKFLQSLSSPATSLLQDVQSNNEHIAKRLHSAQVAGHMTVGARAWLVAACIFHWNRLGLVAENLNLMVARMIRLLEGNDD